MSKSTRKTFQEAAIHWLRKNAHYLAEVDLRDRSLEHGLTLPKRDWSGKVLLVAIDLEPPAQHDEKTQTQL